MPPGLCSRCAALVNGLVRHRPIRGRLAQRRSIGVEAIGERGVETAVDHALGLRA
jgi:hypothetical protein